MKTRTDRPADIPQKLGRQLFEALSEHGVLPFSRSENQDRADEKPDEDGEGAA